VPELELPTSASTSGDAIRVYLRVRPPNEREITHGFHQCIQADNTASITLLGNPPHTFHFDAVGFTNTTQEDIFQTVGLPITDKCLQGYNGTIFAYGQTGAGKTFTIQGATDENAKPEFKGLLPRVFNYLCEQIAREERKGGGQVKYLCKASFLEIYQERIYDLLEPQTLSLNIREDMKKGVYVDNLSEETITTAADCLRVMARGIQNRRVGETAMNRESSRSHCVFSLSIQSTIQSNGVTRERFSRFNMIDLAGSERQKSTAATGVRLKEASRINQSLSALGNVIMALVESDRSGKQRHVHYRDSKLTFLLKDSLGGNSLTYIVACVSPDASNFGETLSTLKFAQRAKRIKNRAVVNEDASGSVVQLKQENERLAARIKQLEALNTVKDRRMSMSVMRTPTKPAASSLLNTIAEDSVFGAADYSLLEEAVQASLDREKHWVSELKHLEDMCLALQSENEERERINQSLKLVAQFRARAIDKLERQLGLDSEMKDDTAKILQDELARLKLECDELRKQGEHNPQLVRQRMEILVLQERCQELEHELSGHPPHREAFRFWSQWLEEKTEMGEKMREMQRKISNPEEILKAMSTPQKRKLESFELARWKHEQAFEKQMKAAEDLFQAEKEKCAKLESELLEATKQHAERTTELKACDGALASLRFEADNLKFKLDMLKSERDNDKSFFEQQISKYQEKMQASAVESHVASSELNNLRGLLDMAREETKQAQEKLTAKDEELIKLSGAVRTAQGQLAEATKSHEESLARLSAEASSSAALASQRQEELTRLQIEMTQLQAQITESAAALSEQKSALEEAKAKASQATAQENELKSELSELRQQLQDALQSIDKLNFDKELQAEDMNSNLEHINFLENELEQSRANFAEQEKKLQEQAKLVSAQEAKLEDQVGVIARLQSDLSASSSATVDASVLESVRSEKEQAMVTVQELTHQIGELKNQLSSSQASVEAAQDQANRSQKREIRLQMTLDDLSSAINDLQEKYQSLEREHSSTMNELKEVQSAADESAHDKEAMQRQIERLEELLEEGKAAIEKMSDESKLSLSCLQSKLDDAKSATERLTQQTAEDQKALESLKQELQRAIQDHASALSALSSSHEGALAELKMELEQAREETEETNQTWENRYNELETQLRQSEQSHATQSEAVSSLTAELQTAKEQLSQASAEKESLTQRLASIDALLEEVKGSSSGDSSEAGVEHNVKQTIQDLENRYVRAASELSDAKVQAAKDIHTLNERLSALASQSERDLQEKSAQIEQLESERERLQQDLSQAQAAKKRVEVQVHELLANQERFAQLSEKWELMRKEHEQRIAEQSDKIASLEAELAQVNHKVEQIAQELSESQSTLAAQSEEMSREKADLEEERQHFQEKEDQLQRELQLMTFDSASKEQENALLRDKLADSVKAKKEWLSEIERCRAEEERSYQATQVLRASHERLLEEQAKTTDALAKVKTQNARLMEQNAKLIGHQNPKQKIQHHLKIKQENDALKQEKSAIERELRRMKALYGDKDKERGKHAKKDSSASTASSASLDDSTVSWVDPEDELHAQIASLQASLLRDRDALRRLTHAVISSAASVPTSSARHDDEDDEKSSVIAVSPTLRALARLSFGEDEEHKFLLDSDIEEEKVQLVKPEVPLRVIDESMKLIGKLVAQIKENQSALAAKDRELANKEREMRMLLKKQSLEQETKMIENPVEVSFISPDELTDADFTNNIDFM